MRAKRTKDTRLVDKFTKKKEVLVAESKLYQPALPTTSAAYDHTQGTDEEEEEDLSVRNYFFESLNYSGFFVS